MSLSYPGNTGCMRMSMNRCLLVTRFSEYWSSQMRKSHVKLLDYRVDAPYKGKSTSSIGSGKRQVTELTHHKKPYHLTMLNTSLVKTVLRAFPTSHTHGLMRVTSSESNCIDWPFHVTHDQNKTKSVLLKLFRHHHGPWCHMTTWKHLFP